MRDERSEFRGQRSGMRSEFRGHGKALIRSIVLTSDLCTL
jgi:hypothetical protein